MPGSLRGTKRQARALSSNPSNYGDSGDEAFSIPGTSTLALFGDQLSVTRQARRSRRRFGEEERVQVAERRKIGACPDCRARKVKCKHFIQQNGAETHAPPPPRTSKAPRTQGIGFNQRATQGVGHLFEDTVPDVAHHDDLSGNLPINTGRAAAIEQLVDNLGDVVEHGSSAAANGTSRFHGYGEGPFASGQYQQSSGMTFSHASGASTPTNPPYEASMANDDSASPTQSYSYNGYSNSLQSFSQEDTMEDSMQRSYSTGLYSSFAGVDSMMQEDSRSPQFLSAPTAFKKKHVGHIASLPSDHDSSPMTPTSYALSAHSRGVRDQTQQLRQTLSHRSSSTSRGRAHAIDGVHGGFRVAKNRQSSGVRTLDGRGPVFQETSDTLNDLLLHTRGNATACELDTSFDMPTMPRDDSTGLLGLMQDEMQLSMKGAILQPPASQLGLHDYSSLVGNAKSPITSAQSQTFTDMDWPLRNAMPANTGWNNYELDSSFDFFRNVQAQLLPDDMHSYHGGLISQPRANPHQTFTTRSVHGGQYLMGSPPGLRLNTTNLSLADWTFPSQDAAATGADATRSVHSHHSYYSADYGNQLHHDRQLSATSLNPKIRINDADLVSESDLTGDFDCSSLLGLDTAAPNLAATMLATNMSATMSQQQYPQYMSLTSPTLGSYSYRPESINLTNQPPSLGHNTTQSTSTNPLLTPADTLPSSFMQSDFTSFDTNDSTGLCMYDVGTATMGVGDLFSQNELFGPGASGLSMPGIGNGKQREMDLRSNISELEYMTLASQSGDNQMDVFENFEECG